MGELLKDVLSFLQHIQSARKGSIGTINNAYLPQLSVDNVDKLAERVSGHLLTIVKSEVIMGIGTKGIRDALLLQASSTEAQIIKLRDKFARTYCAEKGWDIENLSTEQLLEIRCQPRWKGVEIKKKSGVDGHFVRNSLFKTEKGRDERQMAE